MDFVITIIEQGLIYGILALGVYITYKILDFPDLTVDGSFPLGAAVTAALLTRGISPFLTLAASFLAGALFSQKTIFRNDRVSEYFPDAVKPYSTLLIVLLLAVICKILLDLYLKTKSGYLLRAAGDNDALVTALAKDQGNVKILGLALANGLTALAGCIFAQEERVFEISMGTGAIVIGLASVIIGTSIFRKLTVVKTTTAVLAGSVIYKACVAVALKNFEPNAMKLITAVLFLVILILSMERKRKAE